jgi:hypothetical protein
VARSSREQLGSFHSFDRCGVCHDADQSLRGAASQS